MPRSLGTAAYFLIDSLSTPENVATVPDVVGQDEDEATDRLENAGFEVVVEREFNPDERRGDVFEQDPEAGSEAERGDRVTIVVSKGERQVEVPEVVGESLPEARALVEQAGLTVGSETEEESDEPEGTVIGQDPEPGAEVAPDAEVDLVFSGGPGTVFVPNVFCDSIDAAQAEVQDRGLQFDVVGSEFSSECPEGTVAEQDPEAGSEVEAGSTVRVIESEGPEPTPTETSPSPILDTD